MRKDFLQQPDTPNRTASEYVEENKSFMQYTNTTDYNVTIDWTGNGRLEVKCTSANGERLAGGDYVLKVDNLKTGGCHFNK